MLELDGKLVVTTGDIYEHVDCHHRTTLHAADAHPPTEDGGSRSMNEAARAAGRVNQAILLRTLAPDGHRRAIPRPALDHAGFLQATAHTIAAMRAGVAAITDPVLYLPASSTGLEVGRLIRVNGLLRVDAPSAIGSWSYSPVTTSMHDKVSEGIVLKLGIAADQLARIQGTYPRDAFVLTPGALRRSVDTTPMRTGIAALLRSVDNTVQSPGPIPVAAISACARCSVVSRCSIDPKAAARDQVVEPPEVDDRDRAPREQRGADAARAASPRRRNRGVQRRSKSRSRRELEIDPHQLRQSVALRPLGEVGTGLRGLPPVTPDDLSIDFEFTRHRGNARFVFEVAIMYGDNRKSMEHLTARTLRQERASFLAILERIEAMLDRNPDAHIFHMDRTEPEILRSAFLDPRYDLLDHYQHMEHIVQRGTFIDIARVAREAFDWHGGRSLKAYEHLTEFERLAFVRDGGTAARLGSAWLREPKNRDALHRTQEYCAEDAASTRALVRWLDHQTRSIEDFLHGPIGRRAHDPLPLTKEQRFALTHAATEAEGRDAPTLPAFRSLRDAGVEVAQLLARRSLAPLSPRRETPVSIQLPGGR